MTIGRVVPACLLLVFVSGCARPAPQGSNPSAATTSVASASVASASGSAGAVLPSASVPMPDSPAPPASVSAAPPGCDHGAGKSDPAVVFLDPPLSAGTGLHDGPLWQLSARGLPALSGDGLTLIVPERALGLADTPNLALLEIRIADDTRVAATPILSVKEFVTARDPKGASESETNYRALGLQVCERVRVANQELSNRGFRALETCVLVDAPDSVFPPCSLRSQALRCGDVAVTYQRPKLSIRAEGATHRFARPGWAPKPVVEPDWGAIPVRECFSAGSVLAQERVFVGELYNACQQGGDWCEVPSVWHAVRW